MLHDDGRKRIQEILGEQITFEGHFDIVFDNLTENKQNELFSWIKSCKEGAAIPISSERKKGLLGFILKFRDTNFRAILTKRKNEYFIALFLDKHKYYERQRRDLGL